MATTSTSDLTTTATSTTADGPVLTVLTKRIRALRKKLNRIVQMEETLSQGKTLNKEQQEVLRSKSSLLILIDELEKLRSPISTALDEELATVKSPPPPSSPPSHDSLRDLLNLMYFGSLFDVKPQSEFTSLMLTRAHERECCISYDYVSDEATDMLGQRDFDLISYLLGLMVSRPVNSSLSHQNALEKCREHVSLWLDNSEQLIDANSNVSYAGLRQKLNKIMASDYLTATPEMKGPGEVAAAAAVGSFGSFQVSMHEPLMAVEVPVSGEGSVVQQYQEVQEENVANGEEYEAVEDRSAVVEEFQDELEPENPTEVVSAQADHEQLPVDADDQRNIDFKEQQYTHRRGQRGGRGGEGGRRGYPNGRGGRGGRGNVRGGGPYQNERGQYYDNYYPRNNFYNNNNNNRRGGRGGGGGGGGGNFYQNQPSPAQGNYNNYANVGVES